MIGLVGINFRTAPINIREKFSFSENEKELFFESLKSTNGFKGTVILSTCNRTEIYFHIDSCCEDKGIKYILDLLTSQKGYSKSLQEYFYIKTANDVTNHLFHVISGLDSLIIGEDQIIGQVKNAYKYSLKHNVIDTVLTRMFTKAFEAGKKVRTETTINQGAASVSAAAIELCLSTYPDIKKRNILIIGAGQTGELTLLNLAKKGCKSIYITNRTIEKAQQIADKYQCSTLDYNYFENNLIEFDIVIAATSAGKYIISNKTVNQYSIAQTQKQLFIDLSVPRNIDPDIAENSFVQLYAVDDLQEIVKSTSEKRQAATKDAECIINKLLTEFEEWICSLDLKPTIAKIKTNFQSINQNELEGFIKINSVEDKETVQNYAKHISEKYTRLLIRNMKNVTDNGKKKEYLDLLNELFELS